MESTTATPSTESDAVADPDEAEGSAEQRHEFRVFSARFSGPGMLVALFFFALSLFESLLPRTGLFQGVASGITIAIGYGIGTLGQWIWLYLEIPTLKGRVRQIAGWIGAASLGLFVMLAMWQHVGWQNDLRELFGM